MANVLLMCCYDIRMGARQRFQSLRRVCTTLLCALMLQARAHFLKKRSRLDRDLFHILKRRLYRGFVSTMTIYIYDCYSTRARAFENVWRGAVIIFSHPLLFFLYLTLSRSLSLSLSLSRARAPSLSLSLYARVS